MRFARIRWSCLPLAPAIHTIAAWPNPRACNADHRLASAAARTFQPYHDHPCPRADARRACNECNQRQQHSQLPQAIQASATLPTPKEIESACGTEKQELRRAALITWRRDGYRQVEIRRPTAAARVCAAIWLDTSIRLQADHATSEGRTYAAAEQSKVRCLSDQSDRSLWRSRPSDWCPAETFQEQ